MTARQRHPAHLKRQETCVLTLIPAITMIGDFRQSQNYQRFLTTLLQPTFIPDSPTHQEITGQKKEFFSRRLTEHSILFHPAQPR